MQDEKAKRKEEKKKRKKEKKEKDASSGSATPVVIDGNTVGVGSTCVYNSLVQISNSV